MKHFAINIFLIQNKLLFKVVKDIIYTHQNILLSLQMDMDWLKRKSAADTNSSES